MVKFMKSKKGFSLVELMIVVVIMAILVAVAVPIFNSVTGNSRAKTCIDNQRQIVSVIGNDLMMRAESGADAGFSITYDGDNAEYVPVTGTHYTATELQKLFKTPPYCPSSGSEIVVTIQANANGTSTVTTSCDAGDNTDNPHVLETGGSASA